MLMGLKCKTCGWGYSEKVRRWRNSLGNKKNEFRVDWEVQTVLS